ncbi:MAG: hypothetical protein H6Q20_1386 [Bacteroidetes bacterium]|jgi:hypothetical protein|nr:hypothetical protein [Bacteroidota bacterium]
MDILKNNWLKSALLFLFIIHYSNITMFYHIHVIDGVVYCHSHFYAFGSSSNAIPFQSHTPNQLKLIQDFNHITWNSVFSDLCISAPVLQLISELVIQNTTNFVNSVLRSYSLRGPPHII